MEEETPTNPSNEPEPSDEGGRGRQPGGFGLGPEGNCVCPKCGTEAPHQRAVPCYEQTCPKCGEKMSRNK